MKTSQQEKHGYDEHFCNVFLFINFIITETLFLKN